MAKVTVHKVQLYDVSTDSTLVSRRMATPEGAKMMGGQIINGTAIEIDEAQLEFGFPWTARGFNPPANTDFPTHVRA